MKPFEQKTQHHPTTNSTLGRMLHLNNKQKYKPSHQQRGLPLHSALPIRGKANKQTKNSAQSHPLGSLHKPLDQSLEGRNQKEERIQPLSLRKGDLKHSKLKKKKEKAEKCYTSEGTN